MADITITIPAGKVTRVVHALCKAGGYEVEDVANAKEALLDHIKRTVWRVETQDAEAAAADTVTADDTIAS
jgi:hypothetical protein